MFKAVGQLIAGTLIGLSVPAWAGDVSISERSRTYRVSGGTIQAVVKSMKRNGPVSELHGRRALAMADYRFSHNIRVKRTGDRCRVEDASVNMRIFYVLPRLSQPKRLNGRDRARWRRINGMIVAHENQHGRYYRRFARDLQRALRALKPQSNCARLHQKARTVRKRLESISKNRNRRFDRAQYKPFNRRLKRMAPRR